MKISLKVLLIAVLLLAYHLIMPYHEVWLLGLAGDYLKSRIFTLVTSLIADLCKLVFEKIQASL